MRKSFIQKLSIAMASALVITAAAPAQADAASNMKMNKSSKVLYLNEDNMTGTADTYDFSIKNKGTNYKTKYSFNWYAEDDSIVDVAKGGVVTALKVGKTTVKCDIIKKSTGKVYKTVSATVTVKANAETVTIKNQPENDEITVGSTFDFNSKKVAANGGSSSDKVEWAVYADEACTEETDVASINSTNGVVTALKAGTFYVVVRTYQSAATKDLGYTATSEVIKVTAVNQITELKATKSNQLSVTFASEVDYAKSSYTLTNVSTGSRTYVKAVSSDDNKTVTLDLYDALTSGATYKLSVDGMEQTIDFVKGSVASIVLNDQTIPALTYTALTYYVYDENGLDITADTTVNFNSSTTAIDSSNRFYLADGAIAYVTLTYFDNDSKTTISSRQAKITGSSSCTAGINTITIDDTADKGSADFDTVVSSIAVGATGKTLYVQVTDQYGDTYEANYATGFAATFESQTPEVLVVDSTTGALTAVAEGTAYVKVTSNGITKTVVITVKAASYEAGLAVSYSTGGSLTSRGTHTKNYPGFTVQVADQYGDYYYNGSMDVTATVVNNGGIVALDSTSAALAVGDTFTVTDNTFKQLYPYAAGTTTIKLTRGSLTPVYVTITVTSSNTTAVDYSIDGTTTINIANAWGESTTNSDTTTLGLYTVNSNGEFVAAKDDDTVKLVITNPWSVATTVTGGTYTIEPDYEGDKGIDSKDMIVGTYTVQAYVNNYLVKTTTFSVVDTTTAPSVTLTSNSITTDAVNLTTIGSCLSIPTGYELVSFKFVSNYESIYATPSGYVTSVSLGTSAPSSTDCTLTNVAVCVRNTSNGRLYYITSLGSITVDR